MAVVTTMQPDGAVHGMAANSVGSVSPPLVLVCVGHTRNSYLLIRDTRCFAISILSEDQQAVGEYYARSPEARTEEARYFVQLHGARFGHPRRVPRTDGVSCRGRACSRRPHDLHRTNGRHSSQLGQSSHFLRGQLRQVTLETNAARL